MAASRGPSATTSLPAETERPQEGQKTLMSGISEAQFGQIICDGLTIILGGQYFVQVAVVNNPGADWFE